MEPIRILLAEDHTLVRAGIRALLQALPGIQVVAEATDGRNALRLSETERPDVVLMDISMPKLSGLEATARLLKQDPHVRVIILSMHANEAYVWQALRAGASGYLLKDAGIVELELAINAVAHGGIYLSPVVSKQVVANYVQHPLGEVSLLDRLTPRQREILQLIAEGYTTAAIAEMLSVSVKTVDASRAQLMERLDMHDIPSLVRYAIRVGIVTLCNLLWVYGPIFEHLLPVPVV